MNMGKDFEVEIYELWTSKVRVRATSRAEAVRKVMIGEGCTVDNSSHMVETIEYGLVMGLESECPGIIEELHELGYDAEEDDETFIKSVEEV